MKILITEKQLEVIVLSEFGPGNVYNWEDYNDKPARQFDNLFNTNISQEWEFPLNYSSEEVWRSISGCRRALHGAWDDDDEIYKDEGECEMMNDILDNFTEEYFPLSGLKHFDEQTKIHILQGMASEFNADDIIDWAIHGIMAWNSPVKYDVDKLENKLNFNIQWVPSIKTVNKIKKSLRL